jgi:hypothetical protein
MFIAVVVANAEAMKSADSERNKPEEEMVRGTNKFSLIGESLPTDNPHTFSVTFSNGWRLARAMWFICEHPMRADTVTGLLSVRASAF